LALHFKLGQIRTCRNPSKFAENPRSRLPNCRRRVKVLSEQLRRLDTELAQRDLASVPTARLLTMAEQLRRRLDRECGSTLFSAGVELYRNDETRQAVQDWHA